MASLVAALCIAALIAWTYARRADAHPVPDGCDVRAFSGFGGWSPERRAVVCTQLREMHQWPTGAEDFALAALADRTIDALTRNQLASALLRRPSARARLRERMAAVAVDEAEDGVWRNYAVQFLVEVDPTTALADLLRLMAGSPAVSATAALQADRLAAERGSALPPDFDATLAAWAVDARRPLCDRVTALALLARRGGPSALEAARGSLSAAEPCVRRGAAAILAAHGDGDDRERLATVREDADPLVARIATAALAVSDAPSDRFREPVDPTP